jgi:hypothetical protein
MRVDRHPDLTGKSGDEVKRLIFAVFNGGMKKH